MRKQQFDINTIARIPKDNCFICKQKIDEAEIVFEDDKFIAFLDMHPPTKGYTILAPKEHFEDITQMDKKDYMEFQVILFDIAQAIKRAFEPERICLLNSGGILKHWHFHIIPIYEDVYIGLRNIILKKTVLQINKEEKEQIAASIKDNMQNI